MDAMRFLLLDEGRKKRHTYADKLLAIQSEHVIAGWPFGEASGSIADNIEGTAARDGAYTGVTLGQSGIGDGGTAPLFDGANDYVDLYSASLAAAYDQSELSVMFWYKTTIDMWGEDGENKKIFHYYVDANNALRLERLAGNDNTLSAKVEHNGTNKWIDWAAGPSVAWLNFIITISESNDRVRVYQAGIQVESDTTGLGVWSGPLSSSITVIGANDKTPINVWDGWIAFPWIWGIELTPTEVLEAATI